MGSPFLRGKKLAIWLFNGRDLTVNSKEEATTVWRRQMEVYVAQPGKPEMKLGGGRTPVIPQTTNGNAIAW